MTWYLVTVRACERASERACHLVASYSARAKLTVSPAKLFLYRTCHLVSSLHQLCILKYLELGTLFLDAVKNLLELSLASIRIQEKREINVNFRILPHFNFYQPVCLQVGPPH